MKLERKDFSLAESEVLAILRAADDIIAEGGRSLLSKILKGSKDSKLLELDLIRNPSYGFFKNLTIQQIMDKVDHMINAGFLEIEKRGRLPMIVFSPLGWVIERERRAQEFLEEWDRGLEANITPISMEYLKGRNRGMIFLFLYKVLCTGNKRYIPYLTLWERIDFKKVRAEIRNVINALHQREKLDELSWKELKQKIAESLLIRSDELIILSCRQCGRRFVFDEMNPEYYTSEGLRLPEKCINCLENAPPHP